MMLNRMIAIRSAADLLLPSLGAGVSASRLSRCGLKPGGRLGMHACGLPLRQDRRAARCGLLPNSLAGMLHQHEAL